MKKTILVIWAAMAVSSAVVFGMNAVSDNSQNGKTLDVHNHASCEGTNCSGTVGCKCPGFSPITNSELWKQAYCKHCGHHRRSHK